MNSENFLIYLLRIGLCFKLWSFPWNRTGSFYEPAGSARLQTQALTDEPAPSCRSDGFCSTVLHDFLKTWENMTFPVYLSLLSWAKFCLLQLAHRWSTEKEGDLWVLSPSEHAMRHISHLLSLVPAAEYGKKMRANLNIKSHFAVYPLLKPVTSHSEC